jgi:hypothetical protein
MVRRVCRYQRPARAVASIVAAVGLVVGAAEARAAVRICGAIVVAEGADKSEAGARRKALDGWREGASRLGTGYEAWRVATDRALVCRPAEGLVVCRASARPCTIKQVVPKGLSNPRGGIDT